ncbi:hypothetical protein PAXRUDRAFT_19905 [Paxillus rubicundulus Ve08.2h10]|uniref:Uncharacterized protein n=1 Tax=Paxillus rubicundulus Ve08.2h10 TaxID=930991 RepID=A0A0D0DB35_9AGAM|nr:hypothetical protein PAXRUDRAFT_19905 [Paxillus rubicundulus Ve08.2h10]
MGSSKKSKVSLPDIPWNENEHSRVWNLIAEISKPANHKVLFGKQKNENTSGETKLRMTGGGIQAPDGEDHSPSDDDEYCDFYISADGPNDTTTAEALNIWGTFYAKNNILFNLIRPNVNPIAITTGVGPAGKKTFHIQPLDDDDNAGDELTQSQIGQIQMLQDAINMANAARVHAPLSTSASYADKENSAVDLTETPSQKKAPKLSSLSQDSISKAKDRIQKLPKKRTIDDTLQDIQRTNLEALNERNRRQMDLEERKVLLEEFKLGLWTAEEYRERLEDLRCGTGERPPKQVHQYSPDWDLD